MTRDLTHELSSSDRVDKFCHYFCMPLSKVEALTDTLLLVATFGFRGQDVARPNFASGWNYW